MKSITYNGKSDHVVWHGVHFEAGEAVSTDNDVLIAAADKHPLFDVADASDDAPGEKPKPQQRGRPRKGAKAEAAARAQADEALTQQVAGADDADVADADDEDA